MLISFAYVNFGSVNYTRDGHAQRELRRDDLRYKGVVFLRSLMHYVARNARDLCRNLTCLQQQVGYWVVSTHQPGPHTSIKSGQMLWERGTKRRWNCGLHFGS